MVEVDGQVVTGLDITQHEERHEDHTSHQQTGQQLTVHARLDKVREN